MITVVANGKKIDNLVGLRYSAVDGLRILTLVETDKGSCYNTLDVDKGSFDIVANIDYDEDNTK